jgi:hypothetical protein
LAHVGLEFEEGAQPFGLQDWAGAFVTDLAGIDGVSASAAFETSLLEVQLGDAAAAMTN